MKIGVTQIIIILTIVLGGGLLLLLVSQRSNDIEAKYREIVDVFAVAREAGLDVEQFKKDIDSSDVQNAVAEDKAEAERRLGNSLSTPTLFVNGVLFGQSGTLQDTINNLETALQAEVDKGNKPLLEEFYDYNCIYCANIEAPLNEMVASFGDKVEYKKRNLPFLRTSSLTYAYAGEAAERQGKLKEYSEILFDKIHN